MDKVTYEIVEHDGGWAYRVNGSPNRSRATIWPARRLSAPPPSNGSRVTQPTFGTKTRAVTGTTNWRPAVIGRIRT